MHKNLNLAGLEAHPSLSLGLKLGLSLSLRLVA